MNTRPARIMLIDDEQINLDLMEIAAMSHPDIMFYLHRTINGGMRTLHERDFEVDAVILDLSMLDGSGRRTTEDIREQETVRGKSKRIAIFWYTGWPIDLEDPDSPLTETFRKCGVRKLFKKPYDSVAMVNEIRASIGAVKEASA